MGEIMASELMDKIVQLKAIESDLATFLASIEAMPLLEQERSLVQEGKTNIEQARMNFERMKGLRR